MVAPRSTSQGNRIKGEGNKRAENRQWRVEGGLIGRDGEISSLVTADFTARRLPFVVVNCWMSQRREGGEGCCLK